MRQGPHKQPLPETSKIGGQKLDAGKEDSRERNPPGFLSFLMKIFQSLF